MRVIRGQLIPENKAYEQRQGYTETYAETNAGYANKGHEGQNRRSRNGSSDDPKIKRLVGSGIRDPKD